MKHINLLIKPASGNCNLRCSYCFYHDLTNIRETGNAGLIPDKIMAALVEKTLSTATESATFAFQGGEPTLSGLAFYEKIVAWEKQYNQKRITIHNTIQTNGTLLTDEWGAFLAANGFLTGVSLDGPGDIHDLNRKDIRENGSFQQVMQGIACLERNGAEFNILTVVSKPVAKHIRRIFQFFVKKQFRHLQFIPCLEPLESPVSKNVYSLSPALYGEFLITLFDLYYNAAIKNQYISIRFFDNLVQMVGGNPPESCGMAGVCTCQFVVEGDGSVYPCDFYCIDKYRLGNILDMSFRELFESPQAQAFITESFHVHSMCQSCPFLTICRGGCKRYREPFIEGKPGLNRYCESYRAFYKQCLPRLRHLAALFVSPKR